MASRWLVDGCEEVECDMVKGRKEEEEEGVEGAVRGLI